MTLGYSTVKNADLAPLAEAVTMWRNLPGQFDTIATSFRNGVSKALRTSDWDGKAAEAAFKKFDEVERQFKNASEEAKDIHRLLDSALENFRSAQKRVRDVTNEVAEDKNLKMSSSGLVYLDPDDKKEPGRLPSSSRHTRMWSAVTTKKSRRRSLTPPRRIQRCTGPSRRTPTGARPASTRTCSTVSRTLSRGAAKPERTPIPSSSSLLSEEK
ncbi:WXG100 family type VII secretion target [Streptomyces radiopugnans]|uniref:WXG100 family type VII secretion target n=1 Tax=Streptomyces radiopugnans TaxID=403935 RepID=UPI003F1A2589